MEKAVWLVSSLDPSAPSAQSEAVARPQLAAVLIETTMLLPDSHLIGPAKPRQLTRLFQQYS